MASIIEQLLARSKARELAATSDSTSQSKKVSATNSLKEEKCLRRAKQSKNKDDVVKNTADKDVVSSLLSIVKAREIEAVQKQQEIQKYNEKRQAEVDAKAATKSLRKEAKRKQKAIIEEQSRKTETPVKSNDDNDEVATSATKSSASIMATMALMQKARSQSKSIHQVDKVSSTPKVDINSREQSIDDKLSAVELANKWDLHHVVKRAIAKHGPKEFFQVQKRVIPSIISSAAATGIRGIGAGSRLRDICVSAPTGSGKTLAYVIPILNSLIDCVVRRLRALIILPSRDLAVQVFETFQLWIKYIKDAADDELSATLNLPKIGIAIGQTSFNAEKKSLFDEVNGESCIDILVATPGRLMDHVRGVDKGALFSETVSRQRQRFTLQHLKFLIVDEADRLLSQAYDGWVKDVYAAAMGHESNAMTSHNVVENDNFIFEDVYTITPKTVRQDTVARYSSTALVNSSSTFGFMKTPLLRVILSATLTSDPQKLAALKLISPIHISVSAIDETSNRIALSQRKKEKFSIPKELSEYMQVCNNIEKPLVLIQLLLSLSKQFNNRKSKSMKQNEVGQVLIFTASVNATHRLARLLQLFDYEVAKEGNKESSLGGVAEFSGKIRQHKRTAFIGKFRSGHLKILVCSDSFARGIDVSSIETVINYDVPSKVKTYIHRSGRTARAGRRGCVYSLLRGDQVRHFRRMLDQADRLQGRGLIECTPGVVFNDVSIANEGRVRPAGLGPSREEKDLELEKTKKARELLTPIYLRSLERLSQLLSLEEKETVYPGDNIEKAFSKANKSKRGKKNTKRKVKNNISSVTKKAKKNDSM